jgi:hypothetical protein
MFRSPHHVQTGSLVHAACPTHTGILSSWAKRTEREANYLPIPRAASPFPQTSPYMMFRSLSLYEKLERIFKTFLKRKYEDWREKRNKIARQYLNLLSLTDMKSFLGFASASP